MKCVVMALSRLRGGSEKMAGKEVFGFLGQGSVVRDKRQTQERPEAKGKEESG